MIYVGVLGGVDYGPHRWRHISKAISSSPQPLIHRCATTAMHGASFPQPAKAANKAHHLRQWPCASRSLRPREVRPRDDMGLGHHHRHRIADKRCHRAWAQGFAACYLRPLQPTQAISRGTGGKDYRELAAGIRRLRMTTVITTVRAEDGAGLERPFSWVADYAIPTRYTSKPLTPDEHQARPIRRGHGSSNYRHGSTTPFFAAVTFSPYTPATSLSHRALLVPCIGWPGSQFRQAIPAYGITGWKHCTTGSAFPRLSESSRGKCARSQRQMPFLNIPSMS